MTEFSFTPKRPLFRSPRAKRPVRDGISTQPLMVETMLTIQDGGGFLVTVEVRGENEQPLGEWGGMLAGPIDPVASFRGMRLVESLPTVSSDLVIGAMMAANRTFVDMLDAPNKLVIVPGIDDPKALVATVRKDVGEKTYAAIMREAPIDLDQLLQLVREKKGVLDRAALVREVGEGTVQLTDYMKTLGIHRPDVVKAYEEGVLASVQSLKPHFAAMMGDHHHVQCSCYDALMTAAAECRVKGITADDEVLGMAFLRYLERRVQPATFLVGDFMVGLSFAPAPASDRDVSRRIADVALLLVEKCPTVATQTEGQYRKRFEQLRNEWNERAFVAME